MKRKLAIMSVAFLGSILSFAGDILTLSNNLVFEGKVTRIKNCEIIFRVDGKKYVIPGEEIQSILFEDLNDRVYLDYLSREVGDPENCLRGTTDAQAFHGKKIGHFFLGFLFGPFAMIGTAISNPTPLRGRDTYFLSPNKDLFSDPSYLRCYKRKAMGSLIGMEALGFGLYVLIYAISYSGQ